MGQDCATGLSVTSADEDDKDEVLFTNPVHRRFRTATSLPSSLNSLAPITDVSINKRVVETRLKPTGSFRNFEIMPWAAFQNELMEIRRRGSFSLEPKSESPTVDFSKSRTASHYRQCLSDPSKTSNKANADRKGTHGPRNDLTDAAKAETSSTNISHVPPQAILLTSDGVADNTLLEFERFLSRNCSARRSSIAHDFDLDRDVGNIIDNIVGNLRDPNALAQGLRSLQAVSTKERARSLIGSSGGVRAVIDAMTAFPASGRLQEQGITLLADICRSSEENKFQVGHSGGMRAILSSMRYATEHSISLLEKCCDTLWICCYECKFNQQAIADINGANVVLTAMRKGKTASLQERCLRILLMLAENNKTMTTILHLGGEQEVLAALRQFSTEEAIQTTGIQLSLEFLREKDDMRWSLGNSGLIDDIERQFPQSSASSRYVTSCSGCIRYLAFDANNRAYMATGNIIQHLKGALQAWIAEEEVVLSILLALGNMTFDSSRAKHLAARDGGASTLVTLLSLYTEHASISEQACRVVRNVADGKVNAKRHCARAGAVSCLVRAMKTLPGAAGVQEHAAAALLNLSSIQEGALRNAKLDGHVKRMLVLHNRAADAARQLLRLQMVLEQLRNRSILLGALFGSPRSPTPRSSFVRPPAEEVLHEPAVASAVAAFSHDGDKTEY